MTTTPTAPVPGRRQVQLSDTARAALWRQRLFEAEAGMTRFLAAHADPELIAGWMHTRSALFADLPADTAGDPASWQAVFFRGQALMERFVVGHFGHDALAGWARCNADVYALVEGEADGARDPIERLAAQAELYGSDYDLEELGAAEAVIEIGHCAIWDYRERARARGVPITLRSPCEYCVCATEANIRARGFAATHQLHDGPGGPGCRWRASRTRAGAA